MSRIKKMLGILLAVSLLLTMLLSGCGSKDGEEDSSSTSTPTTSTQDQKPVTLKYVMMGLGKQADSEIVWAEFNKKLQEKLPNTTVEFDVIPAAQFNEKWKLMMAASEVVDVSWTGYAIPSYLEEVRKGAYMALDELVAKNAPELLKILPSWILEKQKVNGKLYSIPNYQQEASQPFGIRFQKDVADKYFDMNKLSSLLLSTPYLTKETLDEFEKGLEKAKAENEIKQGVSPETFTEMVQKGYQTITNFMVYKRDDKSCKVLNMYETTERKMMYSRMADWYKKGYIRKDILSINNTREGEGKKDGNIIWAHPSYVKEQSEMETKKAGFPVTVLPAWEGYYVGITPVSTALVVPRTAKNPDRSVKFISLMSDEKSKDLYNLLTYGIEGTHYKKTGDNTIETTGYSGSPTAESKYGNYKWALGNTFNAYLTQGDAQGWNDIVLNEIHGKAIQIELVGIQLDTEPIKNELNQCLAVEKEYKKPFFSGALPDFDAKYSEFLEKLKKAGVDKVVSEMQKQVNEFLKTKVK